MTKLVNTRIQHLVFKIAGQKPTMPAQGIRPDNPAWRPSDIMVGELAYNQTDDAWYYNNGHKIEPFTGILPPTVLTVENVQVFNPTKDPDEDGFAYLAGNTFVSFINEESANPQFQTEAIYRCALNSLPGESPESHPDKWVFQGPTVEISVGNLASIFYIGLDAIKNITGYRNANTAINILTGRIYTYSETSGVGLQPHDNTGTYGRWVSGKRINFSNVAGVVAEHQNGEAFYLPIGHHIITTFGPGNIDLEDDVGDTEVTLQFEGPCFLSRIGSGVAEENFVVVPIGTGGGGLIALRTEAAAFSLSATDANKYIRYTGADAINLTVPNTLETLKPVTIEQAGAGEITCIADAGLTLNGDPKTAGQYKLIQLLKISDNLVNAIGGVE